MVDTTRAIFISSLFFVFLSGCALQRTEAAANARDAMIGMPKASVLSCMGAPDKTALAGDAEVLTYYSGSGRVDVLAQGSATNTGLGMHYQNAPLFPTQTMDAASSDRSSFFHASSHARYCKVAVVLENGIVTKVGYSGNAGGLLTPDEQCAYAVRNCP